MKKIAILGDSVASAKAIEEIRRQDLKSDIVLVSFDKWPPYQRHLLSALLANHMSDDKVFYRQSDFYEKNKVRMMFEQKIIKIDFKRGRLVNEQKEEIFFDTLLIADCSRAQLSEIKGSHRDGLFDIEKLSDVKNLMEILPIVETVVVQDGSLSGLQAACALKERGKEVIYVADSESALTHLWDEDIGKIMMKLLGDAGIRFIPDSGITEILGESDARAVRLKTGKVMAAQAVILNHPRLDLRLFAETPLKLDQGIVVDEHFRTNVGNVFAVDRASNFSAKSRIDDYEISLLHLEGQGVVAGHGMTGQPAAHDIPFRLFHLDMLGITVTFIAETKSREGLRPIQKSDDGLKIYRKFFVKDNIVAGAILINAGEEEGSIVRSIKEKQNLSESPADFLGESASLVPNDNPPARGDSLG